MNRVIELGLFAAPLAIYLVWQLTVRRFSGGPSRELLLALLVAVVLTGSWLAWTAFDERHQDASRYVPAQLRDGRVVPGHEG